MPEREWLEGVICFVDRVEIKSELIAQVETTWNRLKQGHRFPTRQSIDPLEFRGQLPYLSIVELHDNPFRVYYRLIGTEVARFAEEDFSNTWLDDTDWEPRLKAVNTAIYKRVWDSQAPVYGLSTVEWDKLKEYVFEWALFPVAADGENISHCLSVDDFTLVAARTYMLRESF
jgi:hypothetical protein